jgi:hypothetical protein
VVPHVTRANGVVITCGDNVLRVTSDHLIYTQRGLVAGANIVAGDRLFTSEDGDHSFCVVTSIVGEYAQSYFGLNCAANSVVLANGIRSSSFGTLHILPSLWMYYGSMLLGLRRASELGDWIVNLIAAMNLW